MKWFGGRESGDVEEGSGGGIVGFIGLLIYVFTGINPSQSLNQGQGNGDGQQKGYTFC